MRQYISVDVYGNCGNLTCAHNFDCFEKLGEVSCFYYWKFHKNSDRIFRLTLKEAGGPKWPTGQENVCHFSHGHAMVTKILDFIHKHVY